MSSVYEHCSGLLLTCCPRVSGVCGQGATPSVSSINRILRNRAAERAASEYAHHATAFPFFPPFGFPPPALQLWSGLLPQGANGTNAPGAAASSPFREQQGQRASLDLSPGG